MIQEQYASKSAWNLAESYMKTEEALSLLNDCGDGIKIAAVMETRDGGCLFIGFGPPLNIPARKFNNAELRIPAGGSPKPGEWTRDPNLVSVAARKKPKNLSPVDVPDAYVQSNYPPVDFQEFYTKFLPLVRPIAQRVNMNENLLLALVAKEDHWGNYVPNVPLNNFLGITQGGKSDIKFDTAQQCFDYWDKHYADWFSNVQDVNEFLKKMRAMPIGSYNSADPEYDDDFKKVYKSVIDHRSKLGL